MYLHILYAMTTRNKGLIIKFRTNKYVIPRNTQLNISFRSGLCLKTDTYYIYIYVGSPRQKGG